MIFVTVGQELPFDRLVKAVDIWAGQNMNTIDIFAQIGATSYQPKNIKYVNFLDLKNFRIKISKAKLIVSHAGVGTIINALKLGKPILVVPRLMKFKEHCTDHQVSTGKYFHKEYDIKIAYCADELMRCLDNFEQIKPGKRINAGASKSLLKALNDFINI